MKIEDKSLLINLQAYKSTNKTQENTQNSVFKKASLISGNKDHVKLSPQAEQMLNIDRMMESIPEVSEDKIAAIKAQLDSGTYKIDEEKIAQQILKDIFLNDVLE